MIALSAPFLLPFSKWVWRTPRRKGLTTALLAGATVLSILPAFAYKVTGSPTRLPYLLYLRQHAPFIIQSVGRDRPEVTLPPDLELVRQRISADDEQFARLDIRTVFWLRAIEIAKDMSCGGRLWAIGRDTWMKWRLVVLPFVVVGLFFIPRGSWLGLAAAILLFVGHLWYGHNEAWTKFYVELQPVLSFVAAIGIAKAIALLVRLGRNKIVTSEAAAPLLACVACSILIVGLSLPGLMLERQDKQLEAVDHKRFWDAVSTIQAPRSIVFVKYSRSHNVDHSLIANDPDWRTARMWVVYDRGSKNETLMARAPERLPYIYDELSGTVWKIKRGDFSSRQAASGNTAKVGS